MTRFALLLLLPLLFFGRLAAQDDYVRFQRITINDGLSLSSVYDIYQDSKGFMWFGTEDGLNKYDGQSITVYGAQSDQHNLLANKWVELIYEDKAGMIWLGSKSGLTRYNPRKGNFTALQHDPEDIATLSNDTITAIEARDEDRAKEWRILYQTEMDLRDRAAKIYICGAGRTGIHMDAFGKLSPCISAREPGYDLGKGSFKQAWNEFFPDILAQQYTKKIVCQDCSLRGVCSNCPATAYIEIGDFQGVVPFLCELTHQRENVFSRSNISQMGS